MECCLGIDFCHGEMTTHHTGVSCNSLLFSPYKSLIFSQYKSLLFFASFERPRRTFDLRTWYLVDTVNYCVISYFLEKSRWECGELESSQFMDWYQLGSGPKLLSWSRHPECTDCETQSFVTKCCFKDLFRIILWNSGKRLRSLEEKREKQ